MTPTGRDPRPGTPLLEMRGVCRSFGGVRALVDVDFDVMPGEVHGLVGENGAGKSTLIKVLSGVHRPQSGTIFLRGAPVVIRGPTEALRQGISVVHQEFNFCPSLNVLENLYLGRDLPLTAWGTVDWKSARRNAQRLLEDIGVQVDLRAPMHSLNTTLRKLIEIGRALLLEASIVILDEPTASLPASDVEQLITVIRHLKTKGVSIIYVSHRLEEIFAIADRITILRDGHRVSTEASRKLSTDDLIRLMVGRSVTTLFPKQSVPIGKPILEIEKLTRVGDFHDISFRLHQGEILGLSGLVGAGRSELAQAIAGVAPADSGTIRIDGQEQRIERVSTAMKAGVAYVPEDRQHQGLVLGMSVANNVTLAILRDLSRWSFLHHDTQVNLTRDSQKELRIRFSNPHEPIRRLSGGNQQKCLLAKWLATKPKILIVDEPTRGIDVGAKAEIHALMSGMAARGVGIVMISSELPEILGMSDRIIVLHEGRVSQELSHEEANEERILRAATGMAGTTGTQ